MIYIKFKDESAAQRWEWFFIHILRMHYGCFDGYYNGFSWH